MKIKTVKENYLEAMQVFSTQKELREFLGGIHHNTLKQYIANNYMPYTMRSKMIAETKKRIKSFTL
jgi:hypothetical protein